MYMYAQKPTSLRGHAIFPPSSCLSAFFMNHLPGAICHSCTQIAYEALKERRRPSCVDCGNRESRCECPRDRASPLIHERSSSRPDMDPRSSPSTGSKRIPPPKPERRNVDKLLASSTTSITSSDVSIVLCKIEYILLVD